MIAISFYWLKDKPYDVTYDLDPAYSYPFDQFAKKFPRARYKVEILKHKVAAYPHLLVFPAFSLLFPDSFYFDKYHLPIKKYPKYWKSFHYKLVNLGLGWFKKDHLPGIPLGFSYLEPALHFMEMFNEVAMIIRCLFFRKLEIVGRTILRHLRNYSNYRLSQLSEVPGVRWMAQAFAFFGPDYDLEEDDKFVRYLAHFSYSPILGILYLASILMAKASDSPISLRFWCNCHEAILGKIEQGKGWTVEHILEHVLTDCVKFVKLPFEFPLPETRFEKHKETFSEIGG